MYNNYTDVLATSLCSSDAWVDWSLLSPCEEFINNRKIRMGQLNSYFRKEEERLYL